MSKAKGPVIFVLNGLNTAGFRIPLNKKGATKAQVEKRAELVEAFGGDTAQFHRRGTPAEPACYLTTENTAAINFLRELKKDHPIREDMSLMPVRCIYCDFSLPSNTPEDQEKLGYHMSNDCKGLIDADDADGDPE